MKTQIEIEKLLHWAYRDELSKKQLSAAEGIWDRIQENQHHGGIDRGHGAAQRYSHFGLPDPDAELIERAVSALEDVVIDWKKSFDAIAGDLAGLVTVNDLTRRPEEPKATKIGWGEAGTKALRAMFGPGAERPGYDRPRDVLMVASIKTSALVTMHAIKGTRPDYWDEQVKPTHVPATRSGQPAVVGICQGKNRYSEGSYCPMEWSPSPTSILTSRADYAAWHQGLVLLASTLDLAKFDVLPPSASPTPWLNADREEEPEGRVVPVVPNGSNDVADWGTLPLQPDRRRSVAYRR